MDEIRQVEVLTNEEKQLLFGWGENIFGVAALKLSWRPKDLHFLLYADGEPVSHVGVLKDAVNVNREPATVGGMGGVVTDYLPICLKDSGKAQQTLIEIG